MEDVTRVFTAIDQVVDARGVAVDFKELRRGRRLLMHQQDAAARLRRATMLRTNNFERLEHLHPVSKQCIIDLCDLE